ncbi:hypothetical protein [Nesterenkonia lutea]|uniref:DUF3040 domain-containing protein n=1 Tax=Nesterenkonia lutea TaxID=272919 RepID=A0ABR9JC48_9MICC|nr:hypothetical protein [Nesterenkonia lutea]MBE1523047.1 hypothetical protein [Nesterenkonia lutea]
MSAAYEDPTQDRPMKQSRPEHSGASPTHPTVPLPPEPEDVDELLAESLRAQDEQDFTWKEPDRGPRWFERAEQEAALGSGPGLEGGALMPPAEQAAVPHPRGTGSSARTGRATGPRITGAVYAAVAVALALWVLASVVLGVHIEPLVVALGVCSLAGLALVAAGLRPRPGHRI